MLCSRAAAVLAHMPPAAGVVATRAGGHIVLAALPDTIVAADGPGALERLDALPPGWWAGFAAYDLGRAVERVRPARRRPEPRPPDLLLARFPARAVIDTRSGESAVVGSGPARALLERALRAAPARPAPGAELAAPAMSGWRSSLGRGRFEAAVDRIKDLIDAGDCYQVNLTRRLTCTRAADPIALLGALERANPAPYLGLVRLGAPGRPPVAVVSASPECFLRWRGIDVETRPIKGTGTDPEALRVSAKDRAENVMIVDLARNDLGRVCVPGSIHVPALCAPEPHPGLFHLVSTVRGRLRRGVGPGALLRATMPPASVTGAPKPRVLQVIEDLEPVRRGVYCGAVGWLDTERGEGELAVAIRTFTVVPGRTYLGVGAGVVADSEPAAEWAETELKSARLLAAAGAGPPRRALAS